MRKQNILFAITSLFLLAMLCARSEQHFMQQQLRQEIPLLGHRNWIMIVDSAYPLQVSPGVETIETNADQLEVTREVLAALDHSIHVTPNV